MVLSGDGLQITLLTPAERRACYECELCAFGPDKRRKVPAMYWAGFDDSRKITVCVKHAADMREAQRAGAS